jgi:hypothetical protein
MWRSEADDCAMRVVDSATCGVLGVVEGVAGSTCGSVLGVVEGVAGSSSGRVGQRVEDRGTGSGRGQHRKREK